MDVAAASLLGLMGTVVPLPCVQCSRLSVHLGGVRVHAGARLLSRDWKHACVVKFCALSAGMLHTLLLFEAADSDGEVGGSCEQHASSDPQRHGEGTKSSIGCLFHDEIPCGGSFAKSTCHFHTALSLSVRRSCYSSNGRAHYCRWANIRWMRVNVHGGDARSDTMPSTDGVGAGDLVVPLNVPRAQACGCASRCMRYSTVTHELLPDEDATVVHVLLCPWRLNCVSSSAPGLPLRRLVFLCCAQSHWLDAGALLEESSVSRSIACHTVEAAEFLARHALQPIGLVCALLGGAALADSCLSLANEDDSTECDANGTVVQCFSRGGRTRRHECAAHGWAHHWAVGGRYLLWMLLGTPIEGRAPFANLLAHTERFLVCRKYSFIFWLYFFIFCCIFLLFF